MSALLLHYNPMRLRRLPTYIASLIQTDRMIRARRAQEFMLGHKPIISFSTLSPWDDDRAWQRLWGDLRHHTLVDYLRCYELWQLVPQVESVEGCLIEVGVWRGGTGAVIAYQAKQLGISSPVYLCDTFTGVVKAGTRDPHYDGGEHSDTSRQHVESLLRRHQLTNAVVLEGVFPETTASQIPEHRVRFCHIDVDVYASARDVLEWVWPRLSPGGVVVFDDYGFATTSGVTRLVDEQRTVADRLVVHNLNGHGLIVNTRGV